MILRSNDVNNNHNNHKNSDNHDVIVVRGERNFDYVINNNYNDIIVCTLSLHFISLLTIMISVC